ncbi:MAG TPA: hypothetical protein VEK76_12975, partial [Candidatus Binatia bacterium]|nr:hypothetical protein [Candidatus Binatia bacterium]
LLSAYKYGGEQRWADLFGAMLAELLSGPGRLLDGFDLVVASPTYTGPGGRGFDHTAAILRRAAPRMPPEDAARLDLASPPAIVRAAPVPRLARCGHLERQRIAQHLLRTALRVPDHRRTRGRRVLVFDDVFTDGRTLDEVARALRLQGGAREVGGISLCRQPWREAPGLPAQRSSFPLTPWPPDPPCSNRAARSQPARVTSRS